MTKKRKIQYTKEVFEQIKNTIGSCPPETGGVLLCKEPGIVSKYIFDYSAKTTSGSYTPDTAKLNPKIRAAMDEGYKIAGMIHSHPSGYKQPSPADIEYKGQIKVAGFILRIGRGELCKIKMPGLIYDDKIIVAHSYALYNTSNEKRVFSEKLLSLVVNNKEIKDKGIDIAFKDTIFNREVNPHEIVRGFIRIMFDGKGVYSIKLGRKGKTLCSLSIKELIPSMPLHYMDSLPSNLFLDIDNFPKGNSFASSKNIISKQIQINDFILRFAMGSVCEINNNSKHNGELMVVIPFKICNISPIPSKFYYSKYDYIVNGKIENIKNIECDFCDSLSTRSFGSRIVETGNLYLPFCGTGIYGIRFKDTDSEDKYIVRTWAYYKSQSGYGFVMNSHEINNYIPNPRFDFSMKERESRILSKRNMQLAETNNAIANSRIRLDRELDAYDEAISKEFSRSMKLGHGRKKSAEWNNKSAINLKKELSEMIKEKLNNDNDFDRQAMK